MKNTSKVGLILLATVICLCFGGAVFAQSVPQIQTNSATNIQNSSATLNAYIANTGNYGSTTVYFQWGTTVSYGYQSAVINQNYPGNLSQPITGLASGSTYHFRAVAQNNYGTVFGQDMTFTAGQSYGNSLAANAGPDIYLALGQTATLQGSGYDPNGSALNYFWSCNGGTLSNPNIAQPVYTSTIFANYSSQAAYTCTLTVTNNYGNSNSDSMTVNINTVQTGGVTIQTNSATNVSNYQATLNGNLAVPYFGSSNYVYFQYGTTTSYGTQTNQQSLSNSGSFSRNIAGLSAGTTYHFRAVAQGNYGTVYGQDMTFYSSGTGTGYYGNGILTVNKKAIDLTSGGLIWATSINANPSDVLTFAITLQANGQDIHNVIVKDILPANLIYKGNLTVNTNTNFGGDITSGVNIGTVYSSQPIIVSYQAQVASAGNFSYGTVTMNNNATITSTESGAQTATANVVVTRTLVQGAATVSTGLTNNFLADSFFLPLLIIIASLWLYFSGAAFSFGKKIKSLIKK